MTIESRIGELSNDTVMDVVTEVITSEANALLNLKLDREAVNKAVELIAGDQYAVITTGMGKSGFIAAKLAATLSSLAIPAAYLDPAAAAHGDLGLVRPGSTVIAFSNSGNSGEITAILATLAARGVNLIAVTGNPKSQLAIASGDNAILYGEVVEADGNNLAPTTSTTVQLAIGDALAVAAARLRGVTADAFHVNHPAGSLGRRLVTIEQAMRKDPPKVGLDANFADVIDEISAKRVGLVCIVDDDDSLMGIISDGDIRRVLASSLDPRTLTARDMMRTDPSTVSPDIRVGTILDSGGGFAKHLSLPVVRDGKLVGVLVALDLLS